MSGPFSGILVLDLSRVLAGPLATMLLADGGARVIKVEDPRGGDPTRGWGPPWDGDAAAYHQAFNRGKESVAADLSSKEGRALVDAVAARADVLVHNFPDDAANRFGVDAAAMRGAHPRLVHATLRSFGADGPEAGVAGYDFLVQAMAGWMSITGPPDGAPTKAALPLVDVVAGLHLHGAIAAALFARERTGRGEAVEVSLLSAATAALGHVAQGWLASGEPPARHGSSHATIVPYEPFPTADGQIALAVGTEAQWRRLCTEVLAEPELADDPRFAANADRVVHREALLGRLRAKFEERTSDDWIARCRAARVPAGPIRSIPEHLGSPQAEASRLVETFPDGFRTLAPAARFLEAGRGLRRRPPRLGENTDAVKKEFLRDPGSR